METYRICEDHDSYVSYLIDDFFHFKIFVEPHLLDGNSKIIGFERCKFLKLYLIDGRLVMQYKALL